MHENNRIDKMKKKIVNSKKFCINKLFDPLPWSQCAWAWFNAISVHLSNTKKKNSHAKLQIN